MSSDFSRQRFDPAKHFNSVLMQQGRVLLDADWNEWNEILDRHWRSETVDIIGRGVVPRETPQGFEIQLTGGKLTIGRGRIYVDGLQAENHGGGALEFDPVLAESRGLAAIAYEEQPYFPHPTPLPERGGPHLVYVDVWEREVTAIEDPELVENAVGIDSTTRLQTVWQVRVLPDVGARATCGMPDEQLDGWLDIIRPSAGRLTTKAVGVATTADPCLIPPSGGYRGLENRLYRVEIHNAGAIGTATFKWSRDNASLASGVSRIEAGQTLTLDRAVWDSVRRFSAADWVEITDDWREFSGLPGEIRQITSVADAERTVTLDAPLTPGLFPVDAQNLTTAERHTRIKRWDQTGSSGVIPVPAAGTPFILEDGVEVTFTAAAIGGAFRAGDYWVFAARTADASVEALQAAPPRGVHHHYCRLGLITFPDLAVDCRTFWPPTFGGGEDESCDCTICVSAEQHNGGAFTIHQAVDQIRKTGGTICLGPGIYNLVQKPVQLNGAFGVRIRGQGAATILIQPRGDAAFIIERAQWCTIDYLTIHTIASATSAPAIRLTNCLGTTLERLIIGPPAEGAGPLAGVWLEPGFLLLTKIRDNFIRARSGIAFAPRDNADGALLLGSFYCERNLLRCSENGILLGGSSYYTSDTVLARNFIFGTGVAGITVTGLASPELEIAGNTITPQKGHGIVVGTGGVRIADNRVVNVGEATTEDGIRLVAGLVRVAVAPIAITGNRLLGLRGNGIAIEIPLVSALITGNVCNGLAGSGIIMLPGSIAGSVKVLGNELINIGVGENGDRKVELAGIHLRGVFVGAISDNAISAVGLNSPLAAVVAGVRVDGALDLRINDNSITNIAPAGQFANPTAGILVLSPIAHVQVADNLVRRQIAPIEDGGGAPWQAIRIGGRGSGFAPGTFAGFDRLSAAAQVGSIANFAAATTPASESAGVIANSLHAYGRSGVAEIAITGSCRFSDNHCASSDKPDVIVTIAAGSIIASSNRVECSRNNQAMRLTTANKNAVSVVGNIVGGPIIVNNAALPAPWQPLNVIGA